MLSVYDINSYSYPRSGVCFGRSLGLQIRVLFRMLTYVLAPLRTSADRYLRRRPVAGLSLYPARAKLQVSPLLLPDAFARVRESTIPCPVRTYHSQDIRGKIPAFFGHGISTGASLVHSSHE